MNNMTNWDANHHELEQSRGLTSHINQLADDFLKAFDLSHIWVSKDYFDGRYYHLTNDHIWKEDQVSNNHYADFANKFYTRLNGNDHKPQFFLWQSSPSPDDQLMDKAYRYNLCSGFNLIIMQEDHLENYGFGSAKNLTEIAHRLPTIKDMELFCLYLRENIHKTKLLHNPIMGNIGQSFSPTYAINKTSTISIPHLFSFQCKGHEAKLTRREFVCLGLLSRGYAIKDSARVMNLSPRTVEFHLKQVREKLNHPPKIDLINTFNDSPLANIDPLVLLDLD